MLAGALIALAVGYHERVKENLSHRILAGICISGTALILLFYIARGLLIFFFRG